MTGKAEQCANTGNVYSTGCDSNNNAFVGGIAGYTGTGSTIQYCYNTGAITGNYGTMGGIVGNIESSDSISNCWQLKDCLKKGTDSNSGYTPIVKTAEEIKSLTWTNFTVNSEENGGYPILIWETE